MKPSPLSEPFTKPEILRDLTAVHDWSAEYWQSFDRAEFFAPLGDAWSPADNVRHLIKSNRPVAQALKIPWPFLLLRFGFARRPSRSYSALKGTYYEALGSGLKAGRFGASAIPPDQQTDERRKQELAKLSQTFTALSAAVQGWSEGALDRLRLPHPGDGVADGSRDAFLHDLPQHPPCARGGAAQVSAISGRPRAPNPDVCTIG